MPLFLCSIIFTFTKAFLMSANPLLSVWMITYNQEQYIAQALESVLAQKTNFSIEVIIGEDCSKDGTRAIVQKYAEDYPEIIKPIFHDRNVGALKNAFESCYPNLEGKYIACLEGDDYWTDPLKLQKEVDFLEANLEYGMTHSDVNHYYENTGKTEHHVNRLNRVKVPEGFIFDELMKPRALFIKPATVCFRKELITTYFDPGKAISENWPLTDLPMWLDITYHAKAHYFDEVFATYRLLNESASRTQSPEKKLKFHKGLHHIKQAYLTKYHCEPAVKEAIEQDYYRILLKIAYNLGDAKLAGESVDYLKSTGHKLSRKEQLFVLGAKHKSFKHILNLLRK